MRKILSLFHLKKWDYHLISFSYKALKEKQWSLEWKILFRPNLEEIRKQTTMPEMRRPGMSGPRSSGLSIGHLSGLSPSGLTGLTHRISHTDIDMPAHASRGTVAMIPNEHIHMAKETNMESSDYKNARSYGDFSKRNKVSTGYIQVWRFFREVYFYMFYSWIYIEWIIST